MVMTIALIVAGAAVFWKLVLNKDETVNQPNNPANQANINPINPGSDTTTNRDNKAAVPPDEVK